MAELSAETTFIEVFNDYREKLMDSLDLLENEAKSV